MFKKIYMINILMFVLCLFISVYVVYSPTRDSVFKSNIYNYNPEALKNLSVMNVRLNGYSEFVECNASSKDFIKENLNDYMQIKSCKMDIKAVNHLLNYYNIEDTKVMLDYEFDYTRISESTKDKMKDVLLDNKFTESNFDRYLSYEGEDVVMNVNLGYDLKPYVDYKSVEFEDYLVVVDEFNMLGYVPKVMTTCNGYTLYDDAVCTSFLDFLEKLNNFGIEIDIIKTFDPTNLFSDHATGLAIDVNYDVSKSNLVESIGVDYGFIFSNSEFDIRYVGEYAKDLYLNDYQLRYYKYIKNM